MRIVAALGGNALMQRGQKPDAAAQIENVRKAAEVLAELAKDHELVLTHGNGPQVGVLALQSANDESLSEPYPFDTLGAQTQGMIGYWMLQAIKNRLPEREVMAVVTQTEVDPEDPAFADPTKFVGAVYNAEQAQQFAAERGWEMKADGGYFRRVVPSPAPTSIVEIDAIRKLVDGGTTVIAAGGGGIPVRREGDQLIGVEAVIDKDSTGRVMAEQLGADVFLVLTDVEAVMTDFGTPDQAPITRATPQQLRDQNPPAGSMGPKVEAVATFVDNGGAMAAIGRLEDAVAIIAGEAGTIVTASGQYEG